MPKPLLFTACQKAIIDRADGNISLITILNGFTAFLPPDGPIAEDTVIAIPWAAVTVWEREDDDEGKTFHQTLRVVKPDGTEDGEGELTFTFSERVHTNTMTANAFPAGQEGIHHIQLLVREEGVEGWNKVASYPIEVRH